MKKLATIFIISLFLFACNSKTEESTYNSKDTATISESPLMDAVNTADSANKIMHDSTGKMIDTMIKK